jgi:B12-binding domain/radical SAM domain protein of rhizo-twelve system
MRIALVNPAWSFEGSIYFGCREPHLPLEYGYARSLLESDGHEVAILDAHNQRWDRAELAESVAAFQPQLVAVTTAPTYLFWRCPPPELRVPREVIRDLMLVRGSRGGMSIVAVGPHASTTPRCTLRKLDADAAVLGECEEVLRDLARTPRSDWGQVASLARLNAAGDVEVTGGARSSDLAALPPLRWRSEELRGHDHHHHRFDAAPDGPGAEMEASRGCPYRCTFCAKETHRDRYRKRPLATVLAELDGLIAAGARYVYFIDEIFLPDMPLLAALAERRIAFGVQTRIDLWSFEQLDALGTAGCVSIEAGVESITVEGRAQLDKRCRLSTDDLTARLSHAKRSVPFVQATLMESRCDDPEAVAIWRRELRAAGVWANEPVPLFPYPGSPDYTRLWGAPDDQAWERAHEHYLRQFTAFSDVQEQRPVRLPVLEEEATTNPRVDEP